MVEHAGLPHLTPEERRRHLNFVVVRVCTAMLQLMARRSSRMSGLLWPQSASIDPPTSLPCASMHAALLVVPQVGGGPTGVELAAELHDLVKEDIARLQPQLRVRPLAGLLRCSRR